jgi:hypothetical protein
MVFFLWCSGMTILGRKVGWALSRDVLYKTPRVACIICCIGWGLMNAWGVHRLIETWHPGLLLKIYGYGAGAYISVPNYGLYEKTTIPETALPRHLLIQALPDAVFVVASVILAFSRQ